MVTAEDAGDGHHAVGDGPFDGLPALHGGGIGGQELHGQTPFAEFVIKIGVVFLEGGHLEVEIAPVIQRQLIGHAVDLDVFDTLFHDEVLKPVGNIFRILGKLFMGVIADGVAGKINGGTCLAMGPLAVLREIVHFLFGPVGEAVPHSRKTGSEFVEDFAHNFVELAVAHSAVKIGLCVMEAHTAEACHDLFVVYMDYACHR